MGGGRRAGGKAVPLQAIRGARMERRRSLVPRHEQIARRDRPFDGLTAAYASLLDPLEALRAGLDLMATSDATPSPGNAVALRHLARVEGFIEAMAAAALDLRVTLEVGERGAR